MIRTLLASTALSVLLIGGVAAEETMKQPGAQQTDATQTAPVGGFYQASNNQVLASKLLDKSVYNGSGDDAEEIGQVIDVVITQDGQAQALVIGVGGFLGIGTKDVAVEYSRVEWVAPKEAGSGDAAQTDWTQDNQRLVINATEEELKNAPEFDRAAVTNQQMTSTDTMPEQETDQQMTSTDPMPEQETDQQMTSTDTTADQQDPATAPLDQTAQTDTDQQDPAMQSQLTGSPVDLTAMSADELLGTTIYGQNDENLGDVDDIILSENDEVKAYIIDVGGFLGIGEKPVALDAANLEIMRDDNGDLWIRTNFTQEQLENQPEFTRQAYEENPDQILLR